MFWDKLRDLTNLGFLLWYMWAKELWKWYQIYSQINQISEYYYKKIIGFIKKIL